MKLQLSKPLATICKSAIGHTEDGRTQMSDAEVITTALVAARFFGGNHKQACDYLLEHGYMPEMLTPEAIFSPFAPIVLALT